METQTYTDRFLRPTRKGGQRLNRIISTPTDTHPLLAAAGLWMKVLTLSGFNSWSEMELADWHKALAGTDEPAEVLRPLGTIHLTESQLRLINTYEPVLRLIRRAPKASVALCPECVRAHEPQVIEHSTKVHFEIPFGWVIADVKPTKCTLRPGCPGKPVMAREAPLSKGAPPGVEEPPEQG